MADDERGPARRDTQRRPRVLLVAYACEPDAGSEPGAGWGVSRAVADVADGVVLVGPEHAGALERWQQRHPGDGLRYVVVPEPWWSWFGRSHRVPRFVLYLAWLRGAARVARRLHAEEPFEAVHHVSYATYWLPSEVLPQLPLLWGPVGGAVRTPTPLWRALGVRGALWEIIDVVAVRLCERLPATRRTWARARIRLAQNHETAARLPPGADTVVLNHAVFTDPPAAQWTGGVGDVVFLSRLETRKGARLALRALTDTPPDLRLVFLSGGPQLRRLRRDARRLGVADRVTFEPDCSRAEALGRVAGASAAVFAGLREEGGLALAEAMLIGTPVVVLGHGGALAIAAATGDPGRVRIVAPAEPDVTARRIGQAMTDLVQRPPSPGGPCLDQADARRRLVGSLQAVAGRRPAPTE